MPIDTCTWIERERETEREMARAADLSVSDICRLHRSILSHAQANDPNLRTHTQMDEEKTENQKDFKSKTWHKIKDKNNWLIIASRFCLLKLFKYTVKKCFLKRSTLYYLLSFSTLPTGGNT